MIFELFVFTLSFFVIFNDFFELAFALPFINLVDHAFVLVFFLVGLFGSVFLVRLPVMRWLGVSRLVLMASFFSVVTLSRGFVSDELSFFGVIVGYVYYFKFIFLFLSGVFIGFFVKNGRFDGSLSGFFYLLIVFFVFSCAFNFLFPEIWHSYVPAQEFSGEKRLTGPFTNAGRTSWLLVVCAIYATVVWRRGAFSRVFFLFFLFFLYFTYVKKSVFALLLCLGMVQKNKVKNLGVSYAILNYVVAAFGVALFVFVFFDAFSRMATEYTGDGLSNTNSRLLLSVGAYSILSESTINLLFGAGLSSWGGFASSIFYSPYYGYYGLNSTWGFVQGSSTYTGDFYIAHVLGETGIVGGLFTVLLCLQLLKIYMRMGRMAGTLQSTTYPKFQFFFLLTLIHIFVESMGICALEINQMIIVVFFLPGIYFGKRIREFLLQASEVQFHHPFSNRVRSMPVSSNS